MAARTRGFVSTNLAKTFTLLADDAVLQTSVAGTLLSHGFLDGCSSHRHKYTTLALDLVTPSPKKSHPSMKQHTKDDKCHHCS